VAIPKIVILGGGFAGLEAAFLLRKRLGDDASLALVSDSDRFVFRPNTIYIPFGRDPESLVIKLRKPLRKRGVAFHESGVLNVDSNARNVRLQDGTVLPFDYLVIATGATMRPEEVPGLAEHGCTIWTSQEMLRLRDGFEAIRDQARENSSENLRVLFSVPENNKCAGPLYELVFMFETWLRKQDVRDRVDIAFRTYEASYIQAFGPRLHSVVTNEFASRGIDGKTDVATNRVDPGLARFAGGGEEAFDLLVSFPPYVAALTYEGFLADDRGFLKTDLATRGVIGSEGIYAPGDAGDFPVKQAFLAFLQADATAEHIVADVRDRSFKRGFDPVSMCVMEMLDNATFAQVPLSLTGDPARPVEVRPGANGTYKVGVAPAWRLGKAALGVYLPMRFRSGQPFHAGAGWQTMDLGLKGMVKVLAD
jgi:NADH dehydrogenase FAD-containing subunit